MDKKFELLYNTGVVPVIKIEDAENAIPLARALKEGGLPLIEVTLRSDAALESVTRIRREVPDMQVIAGTVKSVDDAKRAADAGAQAIVAPAFQEKTVQYCLDHDMPILPCCITPTEIQTAIDMGLKTLKFFPAERSGGVAAIKDLAGPFPEVKFVPTGGISMDVLPAYAACDAVAAVGGSFMAKADVIAAKKWEQITANCRRCVELSLGFALDHVGMNFSGKEEALAAGRELDSRFPMGIKVGSGKSSFFGGIVELMHYPYYGIHGHIAIRTHSAERAKAFLEKNGYEVREDTVGYDTKGMMKFFYLKEEVGGFALHIVRK